jgi:hypothetical protein
LREESGPMRRMTLEQKLFWLLVGLATIVGAIAGPSCLSSACLGLIFGLLIGAVLNPEKRE